MGKNLPRVFRWFRRVLAAGAMLAGLGASPAEATVFFQWTQTQALRDDIPEVTLTGWLALSDWAFRNGVSISSIKESGSGYSSAPDWHGVGVEGLYFSAKGSSGAGLHIGLSDLVNGFYDSGTHVTSSDNPSGYMYGWEYLAWNIKINSLSFGTPEVYFYANDSDTEFWLNLSEGPSDGGVRLDWWMSCSTATPCDFLGTWKRVSVPEPATTGLLIVGLAALCGAARGRPRREA